MKKVLLPILLGLTIVSCKTTKHTDCDAYSLLPSNQVEDSTMVEGYNESQRILAYYILSLPQEEKDKWVKGTFTEEERNTFLDSLEVKTKN